MGCGRIPVKLNLRRVIRMSFLELAKKRYSCRSYLDKKVEAEKLKMILEAGRVAPTGANRQPQRIIAVQNDAGMAKIKKAANAFGAPLVILVCCDKNEAWIRPLDGKNITDIDASIVTDHMMMEAADLGLDSVWICYFKPDVIKKEFNLPKNLEPVNILAIGYGAGEAASPDRHTEVRKPLTETVYYESL